MTYELLKSELYKGFETAFINDTLNSNLSFRSEFLFNDYKSGKKLLSSLEQELENCDSFCMSVAFITLGGITPLLQTFKHLEQKGVHGRILTTDYLMFSDPIAIKKLHTLSNVDIKMFTLKSYDENDISGFHTKGYIFKKGEIYRIIIGSSNITKNAITTSKEWNVKIVSTNRGEIAKAVVNEFNELWNDEQSLNYDDFIENYSDRYKQYRKIIKQQRYAARDNNIIDIDVSTLKPNRMQVDFIKNLNELRNKKDINKAMLVSATGTGKTYASAFALREMNPERILFIVHREQIAKQAMKSYKRVFGNKKTYALLSGNTRAMLDEIAKADCIFATMSMIAKDDILNVFPSDYFSEIVLDECHHAGANSYQKIMNYFVPKFWLGMTASPDTNRFNIYEIFDYNIAYEIRLQQALEENLLCPFHYFGITDIEIDGKIIDDNDSSINFNKLICDNRVDYIIEQANYYGYSGDRVKGLIFCSRKDEARELSNRFNQKGFMTEVLTGEDDEERRESVIDRLIANIPAGKCPREMNALDYIFSVDIFSEGVDIPQVNQIIMLRPTQSPIVFVQQLGRGLRKSEGKEFVVILDFIGNYKNNFMIPIALSGDRTYNKDNIRRYLLEGERIIPGASTIHFDEISKKRIFSAIDNANFSDIKLIKENYVKLKFKIGRIPRLIDFDKYGEMDVCCIFNNQSLGSYYKFLVKYEDEYKIRLSEKEEKIIEFISKKLADGKRIHELEMLNQMLNRLSSYSERIISIWTRSLHDNYGKSVDEHAKNNVINVMTNEFPSGSGKQTYSHCVFIEKENDDYKITSEFYNMLSNPAFYEIIRELIDFGISRYKQKYSHTYKNTDFVLYQKYTYEDVCRLLNWEHNEVPLNIGGYKYDKITNTFPVFINYDKTNEISDTIKYEDHFTDSGTLVAISKSGRCKASDDVQNFLNSEKKGISVDLFVRKNKDDRISKEFYYLGRMKPTGKTVEFTMNNTDKTAVEIEWKLETPVRDDLYNYFIG